MIEKNYKREGEKRQHTPSDYLKLALYILGVLALGLLAFNQYLDYKYKVVWLGDPCGLCAELNPHLDSCIKEASTIVTRQENIEEINITKILEENNLKINNPNS